MYFICLLYKQQKGHFIALFHFEKNMILNFKKKLLFILKCQVFFFVISKEINFTTINKYIHVFMDVVNLVFIK